MNKTPIWNIVCTEGQAKGEIVARLHATTAMVALRSYNAVTGNMYRIENKHLHFIPDKVHSQAYANVLKAEKA